MVLVRPGAVAFLAGFVVAGTAAAAVITYTYVDLGPIGPLPDLYEPTWALPGKQTSAVAEVCGTLLALCGVVAVWRHRHG